MKKIVILQYIFGWWICLFSRIFSFVVGQYYYFDTWSTYPFQQWCSENVVIKINTEGQWIRAWRFHLVLNTWHFSYTTSDIANILRTDLFNASASTFTDWSASSSPSWKPWSAHTILQIDRKNDLINYNGNGGIYGTFIGIIPTFNPVLYTGILSMEYIPWSSTTETTLSAPWWVETINQSHQISRMTGYFSIQQAPCAADTLSPIVTVSTPLANINKQSHLSGIRLTITEPLGSTNVPYVWTWWSIWTWNLWWIDNQYGVDFSSFSLLVAGNGQQKSFTGGMFSPVWTRSVLANGTTWQFLDKNFTVHISGSELFDYGIEQPITISGRVNDRNNNTKTFNMQFNPAAGPTAIVWSLLPKWGDIWVNTTQSIYLWIQDERAGVNSGTIRILLYWIGGTNYWPYVFSWSDLNLSGVWWIANQPDWYISINNHPEFPFSGTIQVHVYAEDMVGNVDQISNYSFNTRPSCVALGCCNQIFIQTWINLPFLYNQTILSISGGINPSFTIHGNTWIIYCGTENQWMNIYKWTQENQSTALHLSFFDASQLVISWVNIKAVLSGKTLYLQKIYVPPVTTWWCVGSCGWGWWWGIITQDDCTLPSSLACANTQGQDDSPSYYDETCCATQQHGSATCDVSDSTYDQELTDAFERWYNLNITNKCPISEARLESSIIRKELAKMISMFTIQIIGIYPDTHKIECDTFTDTQNISDEMKFFTKTACQLDLMWLEPDGKTPKKTFEPNDPVTRAQFGTILSRLIYGDVYNIYSGEENTYKRYEKHLRALYEDNIMTKIQDPFMLEKRARVLLMLKRTVDNNFTEKYRLVVPAHNGALSLLENVR